MAGRGKGRGSGPSIPIPASSMALSRKDALSGHLLPPPDLYPQIFFRPQSLHKTDQHLQQAKFKADLLKHFRNSRFHLQLPEKKVNIERYSDKYELLNRQKEQEKSSVNDQWNYRLFPDELKPKLKAKRRTTKPNLEDNFDEIRRKLENMEENEKNDDEEKEDEEKEDGDEIEINPEEEVEEENDYAMSYFDNGEDYLNDSDDNLDKEATF